MKKIFFDIKEWINNHYSTTMKTVLIPNIFTGKNLNTQKEIILATKRFFKIPFFIYFQFFTEEKTIQEYDNFIVFNTHLGESHFFISHLLIPFLKKHKDQRTLLLLSKKNLTELIDMFDIDCPYILVKDYSKWRMELYFYKTKYPEKHLYLMNSFDFDRNVKHVCDLFYKYYDINKNETEFLKVIVPEDVKERTILKVKKTKLNLDNFIFIAPESSFFKSVSNKFWKKLIKRLKQKGYDIYINSKWINEKNTKLTLQEAYYLANISKGIISLRSGFAELLTQTEPPLFSIVKDCNPLLWEEKENTEWHEYFNLLKYPNVDISKTFNYDLRTIDEDLVIEKILKELEKRKQFKL